MYKIDRAKNSITPLEKMTFTSLGFKEREHLQEWVAKSDEVFGEPLLIIQKEFSGFDETNERLDLLALDSTGNLVIIENKLDDSGSDVTWQALKYASYCSSLTKSQIIDIYQRFLDLQGSNESAQDNLTSFYEEKNDLEFDEIMINNGLSQRIILLAANFRKEVTSTVLWLINQGLRVQCFKATPYSIEQELILNIEQIIPTKDSEDFMISMAKKAQSDAIEDAKNESLKVIRKEFWTLFLHEINEQSDFYSSLGPRTGHWLGKSIGPTGLCINCVILKSKSSVEFYIDMGDKIKNKDLFDYLFSKKTKIELEIGSEIEWLRRDEKNASYFRSTLKSSFLDKAKWPEINNFFIERVLMIKRVLEPIIHEYELK